jgi:glycosyltransferase 2 family protein
MIVVGYFLYKTLSQIRWAQIEEAISLVSPRTFILTGCLTVLNYFLYACYDILSFNIIQNASLRIRKIISTTMIVFTFNLNLGALIGSIGLRYRIYSGWGIPKAKITLLTLLSVITSWSGYAFLLSLVFLFFPSTISTLAPLPAWLLTIVGILIIAGLGAYLALCSQRVTWNLREHEFQFPPLHKGIVQILLSSSQWTIQSFIIYLFINSSGTDLPFERVLMTVLVAGIAGVLTHIPAGLGVLETVFLRMQADIPAHQILAALLCYRFVYYLVPLAFAIPGYLYVEYYQKHRGRTSFLAALKKRL